MSDNSSENELLSRLERLETLYSEQDYTIHALNETISQQDREMASFALRLKQLQDQLQALRSEASGNIDPTFEPPPHY